MTEPPEDRSGALPAKRSPLPMPIESLPWKPLEDAPDGWGVAHRGSGRYLARDPEGRVVNHLDDLWTLEMSRFVAGVEEMPPEEQVSDRVVVRLLGLGRGWSHERLRQEAADVLGRKDSVTMEALSTDELRRLVAAWQRVYTTSD